MVSRKYILFIILLAFTFGGIAGFFISEKISSDKNTEIPKKNQKVNTGFSNLPIKNIPSDSINNDTAAAAVNSVEPVEMDSGNTNIGFEEVVIVKELMSDTVDAAIKDEGAENNREENDDIPSQSLDGNEEIVIKREVMLDNRKVNVKIPDFINSNDSINAMLEERLSIYNEKIPASIETEFWQSPVNFKGYKFNRKKLVLYGIKNEADVAIVNYMQNYYLRIDDDVYTIFETNSYSSFSPAKNEEIIQIVLSEN